MGTANAAVKVYAAPEVVVRARARVGEGPVWDRRTGRLCWVDIDNGILFEDDLTTGSQLRHETGTLLGAAVPRASEPGFAVAVADGLGLLTDDGLTVLDPVLPERHRRMNDAKCDSQGRLWAGSTHVDFEPGVGALHRWDGIGPSSLVAGGFSLPNGLGWDADDTVMYLADSMRHLLLRASFSGDDGAVGEFEEVVAIDDGLPDGLAVDLDGCVWLAIWGGHEVRRYDPTGRLIGRIPMPVAKPSSCAFDEDGVLYITSATADLSEQQLQDQPLAGSIFAVSVDVAGVPVAPFAA